MARASGGRKKRARKHDRPSTSRRDVRSKRTASARQELREQAEAQQQPEPRRRSESEAESLLFFTKLRKRAKWIFLLLALAFGIGFVAFGVGSNLGGGGVADVLGNVFGREGEALPSISEAQAKVSENPSDPEAHADLARVYQAEGQLEEAAAAYEQVVALEPESTGALRALAILYRQDANQALERATALEGRASDARPVNPLFLNPDATPFELELAEDPLGSALAEGLINRATVVRSDVAERAARWLDALKRLAELEPTSQTLQLEIGQAAALADDRGAATQAYLRALEIDPEGPRAPIIRTSLRQLGFSVPGDAQADIRAILEAQQGTGAGAIFEQDAEGADEADLSPETSTDEPAPSEPGGG